MASFDLWPWWICGLIGFEALLDLWLKEFYGLGGFIIRNGLWPYGFRLARGFVLAGCVAWLDVCPVIWVALMDSSHGRFWIVPGFGSSLNVDLQ